MALLVINDIPGRVGFRDVVTFVSSSRQVLGIALAAQAIVGDPPVFRSWLLDILSDTRLQPAGRFQELIYQHMRVMLGGDPAPSDCRSADDAAVLALADRMAACGNAPLPASADERHAFQQRLVGEALRTDPTQLTVPQAAVLYRAVTAVQDASIDQMVLSRSHLGAVVRRLRRPCAGGAGTTIASPTRSGGR